MSRLSITALLLVATLCFAPVPVGAQDQDQVPAGDTITRSVMAIGYTVGANATKVDLKGTSLMPQAGGEAKIEAKQGVMGIKAEIKGMAQPTTLGAEFLTYVLWSVSTEGRTTNLGEIKTDKNGEGELNATTQLQTFSLIVTAEPYFSVRHPSELVVLENQLRDDTKGKVFPVKEYRLMRRTQYQKVGNPLALVPDLKAVPLEMYEARNAVDIAKSSGAEKYAADIYAKAAGSLEIAEKSLASKADKKIIISNAKQTVQFAEDARLLTVRRQEQERIENERAAAAAKAKAEAEAKAAAEAAEAKRKADVEAQRQAELAAAREAQMKAEAAAAAAKAAADAEVLRAKEEAAKAEAERQRKAAEQLRAQLLDQFNRVLETRDTPRGLVVNLGDVLFDTGKYTLRSEAREKLAKLSGIILAHPGLHLAVEGYTDSTGSDELNQKLSEQRAGTVRDYLVAQGLGQDAVSAQGFGKASPVADNSTAAGRQKNRRVEIVVSGEVIGQKIGS
jgi:outer membrane protein OmpA-like peptidoglycan-associated protein